jgi:hypothetical protein
VLSTPTQLRPLLALFVIFICPACDDAPLPVPLSPTLSHFAGPFFPSVHFEFFDCLPSFRMFLIFVIPLPRRCLFVCCSFHSWVFRLFSLRFFGRWPHRDVFLFSRIFGSVFFFFVFSFH